MSSTHRRNGSSRKTSSGTLSKMIDAAAAGKHNVKWSHVLHYLKAQCEISEDHDNDESDEEKNHPFDVPFQRYYVASPELLQELSPSNTGQSVLRTAIAHGEVVPMSILQALCHLGPSAISHIDLSTGRMLLHTACRFPYPNSDHRSSSKATIDAVLSLLVAAYPVALLHRDNNGCTPLHYLFMYHAQRRSAELCRVFTQNFPDNKHIFFTMRQPTNRNPPLPDIPRPTQSNKLPCNAAIVPDSIYGCIPMHYAVVNGASYEAIQVLYAAYPASKHAQDSLGRTPIHWLFGAGILDYDHPITITGDSLPSWNHLISDVTALATDDFVVAGAKTAAEPKVKKQTNTLLQQRIMASDLLYSYDHPLDAKVVQLLLSSRVSRTMDSTFKRHPLHWICVLIAHKTFFCDSGDFIEVDEIPKIVQMLLDSYDGQCSCQDVDGLTPVALLFNVVQKLQERLYVQLCVTGRTDTDLHRRKLSVGYTPPRSIIQILVQVPSVVSALSDVPVDQATQIASKEDIAGRLPLHIALQVAASTEIVELLVSAYPAGLVHTTTEEMLSPLHSAFSSDRTAHLQSVETISVLLFHSYQAGKHGTTVDGRLAMKMEDSIGFFPIHYACQNGASADVIELFVQRYAICSLLQKPNGDLPLHCLVQNSELMRDVLSIMNDELPQGVLGEESRHYDCTNELLVEVRRKISVLIPPLLSDPALLQIEDSIGGMLPLHIAVLFQAVDYSVLLRMLKHFPDSATTFTQNLALLIKAHGCNIPSKEISANLNCYSALDLHDIAAKQTILSTSDSNDWYRVRELLFSFSPTLESHRHRQELLDHGVQIILEELQSYEQVVEQNSCSDCRFVRRGYHFDAEFDKDRDSPDLQISHSVSGMEESLGIQRRRRRIKVSKRLAPNVSRHHSANRSSSRCLAPGSETISSANDESNDFGVDRKLKAGSSMYDDDDTGLFPEKKSDVDEDSDTSYVSGECSSNESHASEDIELETDEYESHCDESETKGSRSFYTSTSGGSRLATTFEEVSGASNDESHMYGNDNYATSLSRGRFRRRLDVDNFDDRGSIENESDESRHVTFDDDSFSGGAGSFFERAKQKTYKEEKKHDAEFEGNFLPLQTPRTKNTCKKDSPQPGPQYMSEVALRIWTFFVMYCDLNNPNDNYADKLARVVAGINSTTWEAIVSSPLPPFAKIYVGPSVDINGMSFRDLASPKCRELIHKTKHFLGKYEFPCDRDIIIYRSSKIDSVTVEANEWLYITEALTAAKSPGISEENIWTTGEVPAEIGVTFEAHKRPVWIKFTKNASEYSNEVSCRTKLGISVDEGESNSNIVDVVPILHHFNAIASERKHDNDDTSKIHHFNAIASERKHDNDDTSKMTGEILNYLSYISGSTNERMLQLLLHDYPYVIVYPSSRHGTLQDFYMKHGVSGSDECKQVIDQVAYALARLHAKGFCHGNVSMRSISLLSSKTRNDDHWGFFNLTYASSVDDLSCELLGGIDGNGFALFQTETLPPEMFMKVSSLQLKQYWAYWRVVEKRFNVVIDQDLLAPSVDSISGATYVVKCHFVPLTNGENDVPLPYHLEPVGLSSDIWAFGLLFFGLHTGQSLFHGSFRDNRLVDYGDVCNWDSSSMIYERVTNPLVQDVLLLCLGTAELRKATSMADIRLHPYFSGTTLSSKVIDERKFDSFTHKRRLEKSLHDLSEKKWLEKRSCTIYCWDFNTLERFHLSPTAIIRKVLTRRKDFVMPCGFLLLPYNLDVSVSDVLPQVVERFGLELLKLSQMCYFSVVLKKTLSLKNSTKNAWSLSDLFRAMNLPSDSFDTLETEMAALATRHIERFRRDPMSLALMLVQDQISRVFECFDDRDMFLYLIDEYTCSPIAIANSDIAVSTRWRSDLRESVLPLMYICMLYARGVSGNLDGLLKLLFPLFKSAMPPSWINVGKGLGNLLLMDSFTDEVKVLLEAHQLSSSQNGIDDCVELLFEYWSEVDPLYELGDLRRVVAGNTFLWTSSNGAAALDELCQEYSFFDALNKFRQMKADI